MEEQHDRQTYTSDPSTLWGRLRTILSEREAKATELEELDRRRTAVIVPDASMAEKLEERCAGVENELKRLIEESLHLQGFAMRKSGLKLETGKWNELFRREKAIIERLLRLRNKQRKA